jgi:hypothetical protein
MNSEEKVIHLVVLEYAEKHMKQKYIQKSSIQQIKIIEHKIDDG